MQRPSVETLIFDNNCYIGEVIKLSSEPHHIEFCEEQSLNKQFNRIERSKEKKPLKNNISLPHGFGRLIYLGTNGASIYEGLFENGKKHQYGRWIHNDGTVY